MDQRLLVRTLDQTVHSVDCALLVSKSVVMLKVSIYSVGADPCYVAWPQICLLAQTLVQTTNVFGKNLHSVQYSKIQKCEIIQINVIGQSNEDNNIFSMFFTFIFGILMFSQLFMAKSYLHKFHYGSILCNQISTFQICTTFLYYTFSEMPSNPGGQAVIGWA